MPDRLPPSPAPPPPPPNPSAPSPSSAPAPGGIDPELRRRRLAWLGRGAAAGRAALPGDPTLPARDPATPRSRRAPRAEPHLVDLAVTWADRVEAGERQVDILRSIPASRRPSRGYVSIVVRLGRVLRRVPPLELATLRSPRITYKLAQRLVRSGVTDEALLRQLGDAIASPRPDGRTLRGRAAGRGATLPRLASGTRSDALSTTSPATADATVDAAARLLEQMLEAQRSLVATMARAGQPATSAPVVLAGQSLAALGRSIREYRRAAGASPRDDQAAAERRVRATLRHVEASLTAALTTLRRASAGDARPAEEEGDRG